MFNRNASIACCYIFKKYDDIEMKIIQYIFYHHISLYAPNSLSTKGMNNFASKHLIWLNKIFTGIMIKHGLDKHGHGRVTNMLLMVKILH